MGPTERVDEVIRELRAAAEEMRAMIASGESLMRDLDSKAADIRREANTGKRPTCDRALDSDATGASDVQERGLAGADASVTGRCK